MQKWRDRTRKTFAYFNKQQIEITKIALKRKSIQHVLTRHFSLLLHDEVPSVNEFATCDIQRQHSSSLRSALHLHLRPCRWISTSKICTHSWQTNSTIESQNLHTKSRIAASTESDNVQLSSLQIKRIKNSTKILKNVLLYSMTITASMFRPRQVGLEDARRNGSIYAEKLPIRSNWHRLLCHCEKQTAVITTTIWGFLKLINRSQNCSQSTRTSIIQLGLSTIKLLLSDKEVIRSLQLISRYPRLQ